MYDCGAILLGMFSPAAQKAIIDFVQTKGPSAYSAVNETQAKLVKTEPALGFLEPSFGEPVLANLARALRIILGDALAGQWTTDKYALALSRAGSIGMEEALRLARDKVVTQDAGVLDFARRLLFVIPDLPGPFDEATRSVLGGAIDILDRVLPTALTNQSQDVLYEWQNLGGVVGDLATRAQLTKKEAVYEKAATADLGDLKDAALASIPFLARALMGLIGQKLETGDFEENGDREQIRDLLVEAGDLMAEARALEGLGPEQGIGFFKRLGRFAKNVGRTVASVAKPLINMAGAVATPFLGPLAPMMTGSLQNLIGGNTQASPVASQLMALLNSPAMHAAHQSANCYPATPLPALAAVERGDVSRYPTHAKALYFAPSYTSNVGPYNRHTGGSSIPHEERGRH